MDMTLTRAIPWPLRQVGITSTVYWKPTFMAYVAKNRPNRNTKTWRILNAKIFLKLNISGPLQLLRVLPLTKAQTTIVRLQKRRASEADQRLPNQLIPTIENRSAGSSMEAATMKDT